MYEGTDFNGHRPDLLLIRNDEKIPVECEYSDLDRKGRMLEKLRFYPKVIFSAFKDRRNEIPRSAGLLLIPPIGDLSEPEYVEAQKVTGT